MNGMFRAIACATLAIAATTVQTVDATASSFKIIYVFKGGSDGANPISPLVVIGDTIYGATYAGGGATDPNCGAPGTGCGTVFSVTTSGKEKVLYSFQGGDDGVGPFGLVDAGSAVIGVSQNINGVTGNFGLFSVTTSGKFNVLGPVKNPQGFVLSGAPPLVKVVNTYYGVDAGTLDAQNCGNNACGYVYAVTP